MNKIDYINKVKLLKKLDLAYYKNDSPLASDEEYDKLLKEIKDYEENNPSEKLDDSPTNRVSGYISKSFNKIKHIQKMYSLDNVFNENELNKWILKFKDDIELYIQPKYDGLSINLNYNNGILVSAATRGNKGEEGEDVTNNVKTIRDIPLTINYKKPIEIRGEVIIKKSDFNLLNQERAKNNEPLFANPRNAASGSIRQLDSNITAKRKLSFKLWGFGHFEDIDKYVKYSDIMDFISSLGFDSNIDSNSKSDIYYSHTNPTIYSSINTKYIKNRDIIDYPLDGVVIKINSLKLQYELGFNNKYPKWAIALKFPPTEKTTKVLNVEWNISRFGIFTPVAILDPIEIDGSIIGKANLHGLNYIKTMDINIGDEVIIIKSGDVIPKITKVLKDRRVKKETKEISPIKICPYCRGRTERDENIVKCKNSNSIEKCKGILLEMMIYGVSKNALNISGFNKKILSQLLKKKIVYFPYELMTYHFSKDSLVKYNITSSSKADKIDNAIKKVMETVTTEKLLNSFCIKGLGESLSAEISKLAPNIGDIGFKKINRESLSTVKNIDKQTIENVMDFLDSYEENIWLVQKEISDYRRSITIHR